MILFNTWYAEKSSNLCVSVKALVILYRPVSWNERQKPIDAWKHLRNSSPFSLHTRVIFKRINKAHKILSSLVYAKSEERWITSRRDQRDIRFQRLNHIQKSLDWLFIVRWICLEFHKSTINYVDVMLCIWYFVTADSQASQCKLQSVSKGTCFRRCFYYLETQWKNRTRRANWLMDVLQWQTFFTENYFGNLKKGNSKQLIHRGWKKNESGVSLWNESKKSQNNLFYPV